MRVVVTGAAGMIGSNLVQGLNALGIDDVIAVLAAMLACGLSVREAMPLANRAGGIVVGKFGTASVSYDELFGSGGSA